MPREPLTRGDALGIVLTILAVPVFLVVGYLVMTISVEERYLPASPPMSELKVATKTPSSAR